MAAVDYEDAMDVLRGWDGREVTVIAFVEPGVSLHPLGGVMSCEDGDRHVELRMLLEPAGTRITFPEATYHQGHWVPGRIGQGLSITQGATRVDVFLEE
jgi:hypothetical protein